MSVSLTEEDGLVGKVRSALDGGRSVRVEMNGTNCTGEEIVSDVPSLRHAIQGFRRRSSTNPISVSVAQQ